MLTFQRVGDIVDIKANGAVQKGWVYPISPSGFPRPYMES